MSLIAFHAQATYTNHIRLPQPESSVSVRIN
jgi:hypothetical protein